MVPIGSKNTDISAFTRSHTHINLKMYALEAIQTAKGKNRILVSF